MKALQTYLYPMKSFSYTAGGNDVVNFDAVPRKALGKIMHLVGVLIDWYSKPALTTAPSTSLQNHSVISQIIFNDGQLERFNGSLFDLRTFELLEAGRLMIADSILGANGADLSIKRYLPLGPFGNMFAGSPSDFMLPVSALGGAEIRFSYGALASFSADTTAQNSSNLRFTAVCVGLDNEIRIPPFWERRIIQSGANEVEIKGRALLTAAGLVKASTYTAWTAGDLAEIAIDTGQGAAPSVISSTRFAAAMYETGAGSITHLAGEPRGTADTISYSQDVASATALKASLQTIQPVITSPWGSRINKLLYEVSNSAKVKWTGTYSTAPRLFVSRLLAQPKTVIGTLGAKAIDELKMGIPKGGVVKTLSKRPYKGTREEFMPHYFKY